MIRLQTSDLEGLKYLGSGKFGTVLKKDDTTAYKLYHPMVTEDLTGMAVENPVLTMPKYRFYSLIRRSRNLKHSGGIIDLIYLNGNFEGVCIPVYEGKKLSEVVDSLAIKERIVLSRQLVRNAKELNKHLIFPTDYKLNNIIISHNRAQLIDLDDCRTHVYYSPSIICRSLSINALGETIQDIFNQYSHYSIKRSINLQRQKAFFAFRYKRIENYLDYKEIERKILFFGKDSDLETVKELSLEHSFDAVYVADSKDERETVENDAIRLIEKQVPLFDVTKKDFLGKYQDVENVKEAYNLDETKRLVKVFDKNL